MKKSFIRENILPDLQSKARKTLKIHDINRRKVKENISGGDSGVQQAAEPLL